MIFPFEKKSIHQQDSGETMGNLYPVRGSDRDCVVFVKQVHFSYSEHQEHLIPLYYKADWDQLRRAMTDLADRMEPPKDSATNEEMWTLCIYSSNQHAGCIPPYWKEWVLNYCMSLST